MDWQESVQVIGKRATTGKELKSKTAQTAAMRSGGTIVSEKKSGINSNNKSTEGIGLEELIKGSKIAKADRDTDEGVFEVNKVSSSVSKAIADGRREKGLTQKGNPWPLMERSCYENQ